MKSAFFWMMPALIGLQGCGQRLAGGQTSGTETGNARIAGIMVDTLGRARAGVRVEAFAIDHDPVKSPNADAAALTDSAGAYALKVDVAGTFNLFGGESEGLRQSFSGGIKPTLPAATGDATGNVRRIDTLRLAGSTLLPLPGGFAGSAGYLYLVGTPIRLSGAFLAPGMAFATLASLPAGFLPEVRIRDPQGGRDEMFAARGAVYVTPRMMRAAAILPAGWSGVSVGEAGLSGGGAGAGNAFVLTGAGHDIWGASDGCYFVYQERTGNFTLTARIEALEKTDTWSKAALMMRSSLDPASPCLAFCDLTAPDADPARNQAVLLSRPAAGDSLFQVSNNREFPDGPVWLRLARSGDEIVASSSDNGIDWQIVTNMTTTMPAHVFIGLAHTSEDETRLGKASFTDVGLTPSQP